MGYIYMLVFIFFLTANCEEQLCSRFHYEQMTLEKMIRQEMNFEKIRGEIEDELQGMKKEIADLKSESEMLKKDSDSNFEKIRGKIDDDLRQVKNEIADLKNESEKFHSAITSLKEVKESKPLPQEAPVVIFHATTLRNFGPNKGKTLVFTNALTNDGSAYNAANGRFTAPLNGTYAFTVQLCMGGVNGFMQYVIVKSTGDALVRSQLSSRITYYDCYSVSVYAFLKTGEGVWVENNSKSGKLLQDFNTVWNMFSGVLLNKI